MATLAPITPSSEQLLSQDMAALQPSLEQQRKQFEQAQQLMQAQIDLQKRTQEESARQFSYSTPPWQTRMAQSYVNQNFPRYSTPQSPGPITVHSGRPLIEQVYGGPSAANARGRRGGYPQVSPPLSFQNNYATGIPTGLQMATGPATGNVAMPDTSWTGPVSVNQAISDQRSAGAAPTSTPPSGYQPTSQGTMYMGPLEGYTEGE